MLPIANAPIVIADRQTFSGVSSFSTPVPISYWFPGSDWTLSLLVAASFNGVALVALEDSCDNFVSDIQTVATVNLEGAINPPCDVAYSWRSRELPSFRVGHAGAEARVSVTSPSSACAVTLSATIK